MDAEAALDFFFLFVVFVFAVVVSLAFEFVAGPEPGAWEDERGVWAWEGVDWALEGAGESCIFKHAFSCSSWGQEREITNPHKTSGAS